MSEFLGCSALRLFKLSSFKFTYYISKSHLSIFNHYFSRLLNTYDLTTITVESSASEVDFFGQVLKNVILMVPRVTKFAESQYTKYQLLQVFISFLLQLLYHKTESVSVLCKDGIEHLEKELRFLLTILGDTSFMLCVDEHEEFQDLLVEFEAVANEAGNLVYSVFFSANRAFGDIDEGLSVVADHVGRLKTNILDVLNMVSSTGKLAYMTPRTSVVNSLIFVNSLIYYLEDLVNRGQSNPIDDVKDQIDTLHHGLISVRSSIKETGLSQLSEIGELQATVMRIGDLVGGGEYLIIAFLVGDAPLWYLIKRLSDINHVIELTRTKLQEITTRYKFRGLEVVSSFSAQLSLQDHETNSEGNGIDTVINLEDRERNILHHLIGGADELQVISICGMAGVGKTTLGKILYDHPSVNSRFDKLSWCVISQAYQRQTVLTDIIIQLVGENSTANMDEEDEERLVECIYKTLKGRRYLIVMDDVWDSHVWDDLRRCFPDDSNGSRILLTTRDKDVSPLNSEYCALGPLPNDQCLELLVKKVFHNDPCPSELLEIAKEISANCHGLPLTVVVIAGVLSTMDKKKSIWEEVGGNLASYILEGGENSVMNILELSYKHLPDHLKPCFLYFGAFHKDREIPVGKLMRLWISEGLIHEEAGKSAENIAEEYLTNLIDKNLVIVAQTRSDGGVKACVVHDLLRDFCFKKCEEEGFLDIVKENDCDSVYRRGHRLLYLDMFGVHLTYCQHLRSVRSHSLGYFSEPFYVRDMRLLRVLHFDYILNHYIGIEYLLRLRYLVVSVLPPSIGSLVNLEYLRVETSYNIILPPEIMKMMKLRYIHVYNPNTDACAVFGRDWDVSQSRSQTNNLEFLSRVVITELKDEEMLRCLPHLRKLKCIYREAEMIVAVRDVDVSIFTHLVSLSVEFRSCVMLEKISFPSTIKKLTLSGKFTRPWKEMSTVGRLENLEVLKLRHLWNFTGLEDKWDTSDGEFQKLRFLEINHTDLCQWNVASSQHFPRLQKLMLWRCYTMEEIPSEIGEIPTLQLIEIRGKCRESVVESARRIQLEQWYMGNEDLRIVVSND